MTYPWLTDLLLELIEKFKNERLPHALLFAGQTGVGKLDLAKDLAKHLLCESQQGCGNCKGCLLVAAGSHPDLRLVQPEEDSKQIKIEQIRSLIDWVNQTAQLSGAKISILAPAHAMNRNSANALLKILEEPPANNHLILVSDDPAVLLPTLRSRAQQIVFSIPAAGVATDWLNNQTAVADAETDQKGPADWPMLLELSSGSPLLALQRADPEYLARRQLIGTVWRDLWIRKGDVVSLVASISKLDLVEILSLGMELLADVARSNLSKDENSINNKDMAGFVREISGVLSSSQALAHVSRIQRDYRLAKGTQNPNASLLLEALMIDCLSEPAGAFSL